MTIRRISAILALLVSSPVFANASNWATEMMASDLINSVQLEMRTMNAINWRVGERANYKLSAAMGDMGEMNKSVDREEGNAVWVVSEVTGPQRQRVEMKMDRATGQILEYIENGQHKTPPSQNLDIVSQDEQRVTVPAGTFDTIHIVANTDNPQVRQIEIWANPRDTVMEGTVQAKLTTTFMPIMMKLVRFTRP